jgi:hypothetical protein
MKLAGKIRVQEKVAGSLIAGKPCPPENFPVDKTCPFLYLGAESIFRNYCYRKQGVEKIWFEIVWTALGDSYPVYRG